MFNGIVCIFKGEGSPTSHPLEDLWSPISGTSGSNLDLFLVIGPMSAYTHRVVRNRVGQALSMPGQAPVGWPSLAR